MAKAEWCQLPLGEVLTQVWHSASVTDDEWYKQVTVRLHNRGLTLRQQLPGRAIQTKRQYVVHAGQFVYSRIDARNGALGLAPPELEGAIVTNDFPVFDIRTDRLVPRFLELCVSTERFRQDCQAASTGTTNRRRLKESLLLQISIPIPPLDEQRRIVARIEALREKVYEALSMQQEALATTEALFESTVNAAFQSTESTSCQALGELTSRIGSGSTPKGGREVYPSSGVPFLRSLNVRMRRIAWGGLAYIDERTHQAMKSTHVKANDVLLNITGASIGRTACVPQGLEPANVSQHVAIIRPLPGLDPRYLMYWLSQPRVQDLIMGQQKGSTRQALTKSQIEAFAVPVPPLAQQQRIVAHLDRIQTRVHALQKEQETAYAALGALMPSVLDKAFRGEL